MPLYIISLLIRKPDHGKSNKLEKCQFAVVCLKLDGERWCNILLRNWTVSCTQYVKDAVACKLGMIASSKGQLKPPNFVYFI